MPDIASALFTKTQQRLLTLFYGKPDGSFYLNEVARMAGVGKGAVVREIKKMTEAGLLNSYQQGNQKHYQANPDNPVFEELKAITRKTFGLQGVVKTALEPLLGQCELAFIYGSVAKGEEHSGSDIDVMLVGHNLSYGDIMERLESAEQQLGRIINPTLLTPYEFQQRKNEKQSFITRVMEQPKLWLATAPTTGDKQ
ncbi:nucleotidyltransferase domain-containing protein [Endozoicomonas sp. SCSIO W0465]|uniref:nucleotidyltransferase domain-containing protein n=1 Tax=Endozoicomonas sp. SCSIO W0465 TaxID=2918516 RepID=UPI002074EE80|nr:nucleotidyltransferase domain-containing protein [Endozoicomonas sp. SCSIO W0465]USE35397.1 nucleotidyltransferase domain-containing protein [Endozoicomonas sp. SCSIO W0465]